MNALALVLVFVAALSKPYNRMEWQHWIDADRDCQDTRQEVLIRSSRVRVTFYPVTQRPGDGCIVRRGEWLDPYTGKTFTKPEQLDVDHVVPLQWAHEHGGALWSKERKRDFANHLDNVAHLQAVDRSANRAKGAKGPSQWKPRADDHCGYALAWDSILKEWNLWLPKADAEALDAMRQACGKPKGWTLAESR